MDPSVPQPSEPGARWWRGEERWPGQLAVPGAIAWFGGLVALTIIGDVDNFAVRPFFAAAGIFSGLGIWRLARTFSSRVARVGGRAVSIAAAGVGLGFAIGTFVGFILAYVGLLFVTPAAFLLLGIGLLRSRNVPSWVKAIPLMLALMGVVLYGFHAVARDFWDPHDLFWLGILGAGWLLLGFAAVAKPATSVTAL